MVSLMSFGSNDLGGNLSQSDSLLTHVLGEIIVIRPLYLLGRADVMFRHWFPPHIRFPMIIFERSWLHVCCTCNIMLDLTGSGCVALVTLCFIQTGTLTLQTFIMPVVPMMVFGSNDLGGELSQSDSLLTHALVGIPGIPWHTLNNKDVEKCSGKMLLRFWLL